MSSTELRPSPRGGRASIATGVAWITAIAFTLVSGWVVRERADASHWCPDGAAYRFQAATHAAGMLVADEPPEPDSFRTPLVKARNGRWSGQYYPGFPLLLAIGVRTGLDWLVNPLLGGALVLGTFFLGRRLFDDTLAAFAAVLAATSPLLFWQTSTYLSHVACAALLVWSGWATSRAIDSGRPGWAVVAGLLFGWAVATRPYTALLVGLVFAVVLLVRLTGRRSGAIAIAIGFCLGALPWAGVLLGWNWLVTGDAFTTAYELNRPDVKIGFHPIPPHRRFLTGEVVEAYSPRIAWIATQRQLGRLGDTLFPVGWWGFALLAAALVSFRRGWRRLALVVAVPLSLIGGYFFYGGTLGVSTLAGGPRYYSESLPALAMLAAVPLAWLFAGPRWRRAVALAVTGAFVLFAVLRTGPAVTRHVTSLHETRTLGPNRDLERHLRSMAGAPRVVFVDVSTYDRSAAMLVNRPDLRGDNVVAIYRQPEENRAVLDAFPGREAFLARADRKGRITLEPYVPEEDETGPPQRGEYVRPRGQRFREP